MAWYAKIIDGVVSDTIFFTDRYDSEIIYREFGGIWLRCNETGTLRKNFPINGFSYDRTLDAFIPPKPYPSWILDEETCLWNAPVAYPEDDKMYRWNEETVNWIEVETSKGV